MYRTFRHITLIVALLAATVLALLSYAPSAHAQDGSQPVVLNDATPGVDIVVSLPPGPTGVVSLEVYDAQVTVTDANGNVVFQTYDPRIHEIELRLAPDTGPYTFSAERMPGVTEAYLTVSSRTEITPMGETLLVSNPDQPLSTRQSADLPLTASTPAQTAQVSIPQDAEGTIRATFPGAPVTAQVVDAEGRVLAQLNGSGLDAMSLVVEGGDYEMTLLNTDPARETLANVQVLPALPSELASALPDLLPAQASADGQAQAVSQTTGATTGSPADSAATTAAQCTFTINLASVNLRSGPGTGYSVLDYGFRGEQFLVGGLNTEENWALIGLPDGSSAWVARNVGTLSGNCQNLTIYNIPTRDAPPPQVVIQQPSAGASTFGAPSSGSGGYYDDDDRYEHDDDDRYEHDDDDRYEHDDD